MSDEGDPFLDADVVDADVDDADVEAVRRALEQRERGLTDMADELDDREAELDERAAELRRERKQLEERAAELDARENRIAEREDELDKREIAVEERERELSARADELDEREETLQTYVNDGVRDTVEEAVAAGLSKHASPPSRLGKVGSLVLGLVGVTLIVGGVLNGFADQIALVPTVFASDTANLAVTVLLLFSGLAANLTAVAD